MAMQLNHTQRKQILDFIKSRWEYDFIHYDNELNLGGGLCVLIEGNWESVELSFYIGENSVKINGLETLEKEIEEMLEDLLYRHTQNSKDILLTEAILSRQ